MLCRAHFVLDQDEGELGGPVFGLMENKKKRERIISLISLSSAEVCTVLPVVNGSKHANKLSVRNIS